MNKEFTNSEAYEAPKAETFTIVLEGGLLTPTGPGDGENEGGSGHEHPYPGGGN